MKNLAYKRCKIACSIPPIYSSTEFQYFNCPWSKIWFHLKSLGVVYLKKYQLDSKNVSKVSVSLWASKLQLGHLVWIHFWFDSSGFPLALNTTSSGSKTGRFSSFSGTIPHFWHLTIGIGVPQYLCLEIPQSFKLNLTSFVKLFSSKELFAKDLSKLNKSKYDLCFSFSKLNSWESTFELLLKKSTTTKSRFKFWLGRFAFKFKLIKYFFEKSLLL